MKVVFLGTSGYGATLTRNTVSILLDDHILIDAGEGVTRRLLKRGCTGNITHVFLSHGHMDHLIGLFPLLWQFIVVEKRRSPLKITCPLYVEHAIKQILQLTSFPLAIKNFSLDFQGLDMDKESEFQVTIPGYKITGMALEHYPPCIGYRFNKFEDNSRVKSLAFTGDTGPTDKIAELAFQVDLLITECSFPSSYAQEAHRLHHLTPVDAGIAASAAGCARLGLIHHPDYLLEHKTDVIKEISKHYPENQIVFCEDKLEILI